MRSYTGLYTGKSSVEYYTALNIIYIFKNYFTFKEFQNLFIFSYLF